MALFYLAEALALSGATAQGLQVIAAALAEAEVSGTHWVDAELHRLRDDILGRLPTGDWAEVETCFRTAVSVAREQGSRGFELRAAVSIAGLLSSQGRRDEARDFVLPVYGWFIEASIPPISKTRGL
jgi:predicted ATPase